MAKIHKTKTSVEAGGIVKRKPEEELLRFSFRFFDKDDIELCPLIYPDGYVQVLAARLKELENWTVKDFQTKFNKTLRNHIHTWQKTSRPSGFSKLPPEWAGYNGWQFCLTANEYGRVHGVISGSVFHVIWLDRDHALYPSK